jgi:2-amino-4-hydroxy-6-hydroxymethyldihydropteridine diphosphokinase
VAYGARVLASDALTLPHPRYGERAFVLIPLREIAPGFVCPRTGQTIDEMIGRLPGGGGVERISGRSLMLRG